MSCVENFRHSSSTNTKTYKEVKVPILDPTINSDLAIPQDNITKSLRDNWRCDWKKLCKFVYTNFYPYKQPSQSAIRQDAFVKDCHNNYCPT